MNEYLPLIGEAMGYIFGAGGLFLHYRSRAELKAVRKKMESDALDGMQKTYKTFVDDYDKRFAEMQQELSQAKEQIKLLTQTLEEVQKKCKNCVLANS